MIMMWIKGGVIKGDGILHCEDGRTIINARREMWEAEGWSEYVAPQPSAEELARQEALAEIENLKEQLAASDYKAIKHSEGWISDEDYASIKAERQALRERINDLEETL